MKIYLKDRLVRKIRGKITVSEVRKEMIFGSSYWEVWKVKGLKKNVLKKIKTKKFPTLINIELILNNFFLVFSYKFGTQLVKNVFAPLPTVIIIMQMGSS